jgi:septal ring factor EnvC (AmiA/AmiB activator)
MNPQHLYIESLDLEAQSDADRVKLHFEIRKQGKPVDPAQYLPKR